MENEPIPEVPTETIDESLFEEFQRPITNRGQRKNNLLGAPLTEEDQQDFIENAGNTTIKQEIIKMRENIMALAVCVAAILTLSCGLKISDILHNPLVLKQYLEAIGLALGSLLAGMICYQYPKKHVHSYLKQVQSIGNTLFGQRKNS